MRAIQRIPTCQVLDDDQKSLHPCALDESGLRIGRVNKATTVLLLFLQVVGIPDERLGEEVCAWIKLRENEEATETEIKEFCKGKVSCQPFCVFIPYLIC